MSIAFSFDSFNLMRARPVRVRVRVYGVTKKYPVPTCFYSMLQSDMLPWKPDKGSILYEYSIGTGVDEVSWVC